MKKLNNILILACCIIGIIMGTKAIINQDIGEALVCFTLIPVSLIPTILRRLKLNIPIVIEFIYLLFILFAQGFGSALNFYQIFEPYDKIMHFISGVLTAFLGIVILAAFNKYDSKSIIFNTIFVIAFVLMIASCWEFFEFACDSIGGGNAQRVIETGVSDTMKDMIMAFLGSLVFLLQYSYEELNNKKIIVKRFISELKKQ